MLKVINYCLNQYKIYSSNHNSFKAIKSAENNNLVDSDAVITHLNENQLDNADINDQKKENDETIIIFRGIR
jgi:hypothetical protein